MAINLAKPMAATFDFRRTTAAAMISSVKPKKLLCSRRRPVIVHCHGYPAPSVFEGNLTTSRSAFPYNCISNQHTRHAAKTISSSTTDYTDTSITLSLDEPRTGVDILVEALQREGLSDVFTNKDQSISISALMETTIDTHVFLSRHSELSAAKGYAMASGLPGVCITSGSSNLFYDEIAHAFENNVPLLVMAVDGWEKGKERSITPTSDDREEFFKCRFRITSTKDIPSIVRKALFVVRSGRPAPVLIEGISYDVLRSRGIPVWDNCAPPPPPPILPPAAQRPTDVELEKVVRLLMESKRPLICTRSGCFEWRKELSMLVDLTGIPVLNVATDIPVYLVDNVLKFSDINECCILSCQQPYDRFSLQNFDLLLALDTSYYDQEKILSLRQIDSSTVILFGGCEFEHDEKELKKENFQPGTVSYVDCDDMKSVLTRLNHLLDTEGFDHNNPDLYNWREKIKEANSHMDDIKENTLTFVDRCLNDILEDDQTFMFSFLNCHRVKFWDWFAHDFGCDTWTNLPAAAGAAIGKIRASDDGDEVNVIYYFEHGVEHIKFYQELLVIKRENIHLKIVLCNDILNNEKLQNPDFLSVVRSLGIPSAKVTEIDKLPAALKVMMETLGPYFLVIMFPFD